MTTNDSNEGEEDLHPAKTQILINSSAKDEKKQKEEEKKLKKEEEKKLKEEKKLLKMQKKMKKKDKEKNQEEKEKGNTEDVSGGDLSDHTSSHSSLPRRESRDLTLPLKNSKPPITRTESISSRISIQSGASLKKSNSTNSSIIGDEDMKHNDFVDKSYYDSLDEEHFWRHSEEELDDPRRLSFDSNLKLNTKFNLAPPPNVNSYFSSFSDSEGPNRKKKNQTKTNPIQESNYSHEDEQKDSSSENISESTLQRAAATKLWFEEKYNKIFALLNKGKVYNPLEERRRKLRQEHESTRNEEQERLERERKRKAEEEKQKQLERERRRKKEEEKTKAQQEEEEKQRKLKEEEERREKIKQEEEANRKFQEEQRAKQTQVLAEEAKRREREQELKEKEGEKKPLNLYTTTPLTQSYGHRTGVPSVITHLEKQPPPEIFQKQHQRHFQQQQKHQQRRNSSETVAKTSLGDDKEVDSKKTHFSNVKIPLSFNPIKKGLKGMGEKITSKIKSSEANSHEKHVPIQKFSAPIDMNIIEQILEDGSENYSETTLIDTEERELLDSLDRDDSNNNNQKTSNSNNPDRQTCEELIEKSDKLSKPFEDTPLSHSAMRESIHLLSQILVNKEKNAPQVNLSNLKKEILEIENILKQIQPQCKQISFKIEKFQQNLELGLQNSSNFMKQFNSSQKLSQEVFF